MRTRVLVVCALLVGGASGALAQTRTPDAEQCGPYPTNYKDIIGKWLEAQLVDPASARIEWKNEPKPTDLGSKGEHLYGYLVTFTIDARNRFGTYTGKQAHGALIRNGEVIKGTGFGY